LEGSEITIEGDEVPAFIVGAARSGP
jgi:hypothetical protein